MSPYGVVYSKELSFSSIINITVIIRIRQTAPMHRPANIVFSKLFFQSYNCTIPI